MINIAIAGAAGRMGKTLIESCHRHEKCNITHALEHQSHPLLGSDIGIIAGIKSLNLPLSNKIDANFDVLIDFTSPQATLTHINYCVQNNRKIVIGTTGFTETDKKVIQQASTQIPIVFAPNMSVGVNLCFKLTQIASEMLANDFDIEILEAHHRHKVDAPSGTALKLGEIVAKALKSNLKDCAIYGREGITGERKRNTIGFQTTRAGDIVGEHTVLYAGLGESIEITHKATNRMTFATGAIRAAIYLGQQKTGLYDMQDILNLKSTMA